MEKKKEISNNNAPNNNNNNSVCLSLSTYGHKNKRNQLYDSCTVSGQFLRAPGP